MVLNGWARLAKTVLFLDRCCIQLAPPPNDDDVILISTGSLLYPYVFLFA